MTRIMTIAKLCALFCALLVSSCAPVKSGTVTTSVCELVKQPEHFNGKTVQVRGVVSGGFESMSLRAIGKRSCFGASSRNMINGVGLSFSSSNGVADSGISSLRKVMRKYYPVSMSDVSVVATITGVFVHGKRPHPIRNLIVKQASDIKVVSKTPQN